MCGIVGIVGPQKRSWLSSMNMLLEHRGPDDLGEYRDQEAEVALAMRRLSILDLEGGHQPMSNEDGSIWIVFNGEIYNSPELRSHLEARGHRFQTSHSDTECLLHLYEEKGETMLADLNGMFAFVIYDRKRQRVFGARDRFGIKPLYYARSSGRFAFASELKSLLLLPFVTRELNLQSLYHYLSLRYVPGPGSIFRDIQRLPPAYYFIYDLKRKSLSLTRYWQPEFGKTEQHSIDEWSEIIREELRAAVRRWVLSDVPVACSLSGGIDSTAIVGLLAEMGYPQIRTYSLGFQEQDGEGLNELHLARQVAERWGTKHHELILTPDDLLKDLVRMVWSLDEPYGGGLPSWYVFKFMSQDVKVGLTGTGGDELFGSYAKWQRYEESLYPHRFSLKSRGKRLIKRFGRKLPANWIGSNRQRQWAQQFQAFSQPFDTYPYYFDDIEKRESVVSFSLEGITSTANCFQHLYEQSNAYEMRNGIASVDLQTQLPEEFLLMTDRFSMSHSLEARTPFLDHLFAERILAIPPEIRTRPGDLKYLLKKAIAHLLPDELRQAPKRGFVIPNKVWLRTKLRPLVERLLAPEYLTQHGLLSPEIYPRFVQPHLEGKADFSGKIWTLLMFQMWHVVFIEEKSVSAPSFSWDDMI